MAPQQNSTLIEDDILAMNAFIGNTHNTPRHTADNDDDEEIIKRYSPILPPMPAQLAESVSNKKKDCIYDAKEQTRNHCVKYSYQRKFESAQCHYNNNNKYRNSSKTYTHSRRSRSISLQGANSTTEQGNKEIPIWIGNEPRYVSGVTNKTTCNDIIKALIDDEIQNGNYAYSGIVKSEHTQTKNGGNSVGATSRDYSDYVISECWRGIERSYDGNMTILPVWKAWSRVHNEIRLTLRHRSEIRDTVEVLKTTPKSQSFIRKYLKKFSCLWRKDKIDEVKKFKSTPKIKESCLLSKNDKIPDEFLFVLLPDKFYDKEKPKQQLNNNFNNKHYLNAITEEPNEPKDKQSKLQKFEERRKKRRKSQQRDISTNCIRRRPRMGNATAHAIRNSVRYRLAQKTTEMDELYKREYALTRQLNEKCKLYRQQNQIYSNPEQQWDISIGQVQRKIENYAQEIVRTEHELLELKNEIRQDISLINNLKRMTLERNEKVKEILSTEAKSKSIVDDTLEIQNAQILPTTPETKHEQIQFVDNIYEFCDKNASMLV